MKVTLLKVKGLEEVSSLHITCYYLIQGINYRKTKYRRRTISKQELLTMKVAELISLIETNELYYEPSKYNNY
jgi:hypothetical protein